MFPDADALELENADPDLAVARGAALFGKSLHRKTERIEAGAARAVFLEVLKERSPEFGNRARPSLVCVLPRGASPEQRFDITGAPLEGVPRDGAHLAEIVERWREPLRALILSRSTQT